MNEKIPNIVDLYVQSASLIMQKQAVSISDFNSKTILYTSPIMRGIIDNKNRNFQIDGLHLWELPEPIAKLSGDFSQLLDRMVMTRDNVSALLLHDFSNSGSLEIRKIIRTPIFDISNYQILGIMDEITRFKIYSNFAYMLAYMSKQFGKKDQVMVGNPAKIQLSKRQHEVLFLLLLGKSPRDIAEIICKLEGFEVKPTTIMSVINKNLYEKFEVYSVDQLVEKALLLGYGQSVPELFLKRSPGIIINL